MAQAAPATTPGSGTSLDPGEVERIVLEAVAEALDVEQEEVQATTRLEDELSAESLDYLDITFKLEQEFRINLPRLNVLQRAEEHFGEGTLVDKGLITDRGLATLRLFRPDIDPAELKPGLRASDMSRFMTPQTFISLVLRLLDAKQETLNSMPPCPVCGSQNFAASTAASELVCQECNQTFPVPSGDEVLLQDLLAAEI